FADEVAIQMLGELRAQSETGIDPELLARFTTALVNHSIGDSFGFVGGEEGFASAALGKVLDVVRAQVVQKRARILATDLNLAVVRPIEEGRVLASMLGFVGSAAELGRHGPAGLFGEASARCGLDVMKRRVLCHGYSAATAIVLWASGSTRQVW